MKDDQLNQNKMYTPLTNQVLGFHGCSTDTCEEILHHNKQMKSSKNDYDWLGNGIYFWEHNLGRAWEWAKNHHPKNPAVIGAVIDLGYCLNLLNSEHLQLLKKEYSVFEMECKILGVEIPKNRNVRDNNDLLLRNLDCAVIQHLHATREKKQLRAFDSVRGVFWEGDELYPTSGFREKSHIQLCICNPNCIKGLFLPRDIDEKYKLP